MSAFLNSWQVMSLRSFRWFTINNILGFLSIGLTNIILGWIIMNVDNSKGSPAEVMICLWLPTILLAPICGTIADRYSRKWIMILSTLSRGILLVGLIMTFRQFSNTTVYATAIILSILGNLYGPAAYAYIRDTIPHDQLLHANIITSTVYEMGNVIGMGSAGFLLALTSHHISLAISGCLFIGSAACLLRVNSKPISATLLNNHKKNKNSEKGFLWKNMKDGFLYLLQRKNLCIIYSIQLLLMINFLTAPILLIPFAKNVLNTTTIKFGVIQACFSVGILLGGITSSFLVETFGLKEVLLTKLFGVFFFFLCFALVSNLWLANLFYFLIGFCLISWTLVFTKAQSLTDADYLGRAQSVFNALTAILVLVVFFLIKILDDLIPTRAWYGLEILIAAIAFYLLLKWQDTLKIQ